ncbi:MAG: PH domain-containing protein [Micavibrio sp.]|nr:PH domain-containing protein [Micavibrio sp.]
MNDRTRDHTQDSLQGHPLVETPQVPRPLSRFLQQTLLPDEVIVRRGEFHWVYTFRAFVTAVFFIGLGLGGQVLMHYLNQPMPVRGQPAPVEAGIRPVELIPPLFGLFIGGFSFLARMIYKWTTEIVLTDQRFLYKSGVFSILVYKLGVREINYCNITQSLLGNLLNYGRVYMVTYTLDDKNIYLPPIAGPHSFSTAIENVKKLGH